MPRVIGSVRFGYLLSEDRANLSMWTKKRPVDPSNLIGHQYVTVIKKRERMKRKVLGGRQKNDECSGFSGQYSVKTPTIVGRGVVLISANLLKNMRVR